jgi:hypothetical protein
LPAGAWGIAVAAIAVAILSLWDITVTDILMVRTFAEEVFTQFQLGAGPWSATAVSLPIVALLAGLWLAIMGFMGERGEGTFWGKVQSPRLVELGPARYLLGALMGAVVAMFFLVPLLALIRAVGSFNNLVTAWRTAEHELLGTLCIAPGHGRTLGAWRRGDAGKGVGDAETLRSVDAAACGEWAGRAPARAPRRLYHLVAMSRATLEGVGALGACALTGAAIKAALGTAGVAVMP